MSDDPNDKVGKPVTGVVTAYYPSEGEQDPHNVYIDGYDQGFSTFDDATAEPIEEGIEITFRAEKNGQWWNIKDGTVAVVDRDPDTEDEDTGEKGSIKSSEGVVKNGNSGELFESPGDRSRRCNTALMQAVDLVKPMVEPDISEDRYEELVNRVLTTAPKFEQKLREMNRQAAGETA